MNAENDDTSETRQRLFEQTKAELNAQQLANATSFDTAVLTLSSAFLALSVTFIKDVVSPIATANWLPLLYVSWFSFCGAIISTVCSFTIGQHGYKTLRDAAERYYIKGERSAFSVSVVISRRIECANILSGALFVIGVIAVLFFVFLNFLGR